MSPGAKNSAGVLVPDQPSRPAARTIRFGGAYAGNPSEVTTRTGRKQMGDPKGHKTESDVEPEAHESRSRAAAGEADGSYVGAAGPDDSFDAGETGAEARSQQG